MVDPILKRLSPINDTSAWWGKDFSGKKNWFYQLTPRERQEVISTDGKTLKNKKNYFSTNEEPFFLPEFEQKLLLLKKEVIRGKGFCLLRNLPVLEQTREKNKAMLFGLASYFGKPVSQNFRGEIMVDVTLPKKKASSFPRGYLSREALPFHNDSSDLIMLLCLTPAETGGMNSIVSASSIYNLLLERDKNLLDLYYRGFHYDRRGEEGKGELPFTPRVPIFSYFGGDLSCRYLRGFIEEALPKTRVPLSQEEIKALDRLDEIMALEGLSFPFFLEAGDLLILNNYVVLHSRTAFFDASNNSDEKKRHLLRLWVKVPQIRNLAPSFILLEKGKSRRDGYEQKTNIE